MSLKITFLGTGTSQGVPVIACSCKVCSSAHAFDKRLRTAVMVENDNTRIVIDCGPDFRQQMLREKVTHLDAVVLTHEHKDHIAGLDDVRAFNYFQHTHMEVYATHRVQQAVKREYAYVFSNEKYPGTPLIHLNEIALESFSIKDLRLIPIEVIHYKLPVLGFRIGDFSYITDAKTISSSEKKKLMGSKILVLNALRQESHISHLTLSEALELIEELQPQKAYLTHISHQLGLHQEVSDFLPQNVFLAYDGLQLKL